MTRTRRLRQDDSGASAIEFALILPIMVLMVLGTLDYGLAINAKLQLEKQVNLAQLAALQSQDQIAAIDAFLDSATLEGMGFSADTITIGKSSFCVCPSNVNADLTTTTANHMSCSSTCTVSGATRSPYLYYRVDVTAGFDLPFPFPYFEETVTFNLTRVIQVNGG